MHHFSGKRLFWGLLAAVLLLSALPAAAAKVPVAPYSDVFENDWFAQDVVYMYNCDYMVGSNVPSGFLFKPKNNTTRSEVVTILWRVAGFPITTDLPLNPFTDTQRRTYYRDAVTWGAYTGVVSGYSDGNFGPLDNVTREQLASMIYRFNEYMGYTLDVKETGKYDSFTDKKAVSKYAVASLRWAVNAGIITGSAGKLSPKNFATRAEIAAMITRYVKMIDALYDVPYTRPAYAEDDWRSHPDDYKLVAFTFDDVPSFPSVSDGNATVRFIDTLSDPKYDGGGTLFSHGANLKRNGPTLLNYGLSHHFEIGNHSYSHPNFAGISAQEITREYTAMDHMVRALTGVQPRFVRNPGVYELPKETAMEVGRVMVRGDVIEIGGDATPEQELEAFVKEISDGSIVLIHGFNGTVCEIFPTLIDTLYNDGYRFCTLSELFDLKGITEIPTDHQIWGVHELMK